MYHKMYLQNSVSTTYPRNIAYFRCLIVNTLVKGIDDDEYNNNNNNNNNKTKYYATKILSTETDSKCRLCQQFDEKQTT